MLRSSERKVESGIVTISLVVGFSLYFIGEFIFALGSSERLPPLLSGFGPTLIGLFSGCYLISEIDEPTKKIKQTINKNTVSGLPETVNLIVSGQEYISIGETIN